MKCFILTRQSVGTNDPEESLSLDVQVKECKALAKSKGFEVVEIFKEPATSGRLYPSGYEALSAQDIIYLNYIKETKKIGQYRKGLGEILRRLDEVDYIVCYDITRFFRPLNGSYLSNLLTQTLQVNGVKLVTLKEGEIDFSRFQDNLISSLTSQINSEQLQIQREKAKAGMKRLKDTGEYYAGFVKVIGYKNVGNKKIEIDQRGSAVVKDIFKMFVEDGLTLNEIARQISSKYPDVFKRCWSVTVKNILTNPIYAGYMWSSDGELIKAKQIEGKAIISYTTWDSANKVINARKTSAYRHKEAWLPLTPFIWCGQCGEKMRTHLGKNLKPNYSCQRHLKDGKSPCKNTIMAFYDGKEGNGLFEAIRPLLVAEAIDRMKSTTDEKIQNRLKIIEMNLSNLNSKEKKMTALWLNSSMTDEVYESSMNDIKTKRKELEKEKSSLDLEANRDTSQFEWVKWMMKFNNDLLTHAEYDLLISGLIKKILIYKDFIEVKTRLGDVTLPRQQIYKWRVVCPYDIRMKRHGTSIFYFKGKTRIISAKERTFAKMFATLGSVKLFSIE